LSCNLRASFFVAWHYKSQCPFKVGQLFLSFDPTSPEKHWPGTKWQQITGRFLRMANDTGTGGSDTTTLTLAQLPKWSATIGARPGSTDSVQGVWAVSGSASTGTASNTSSVAFASASRTCHVSNTTLSFGGGEAHSNMPAYQDVYAWRRTA
ncbi:hypothetical protein, partial [uncultured Adlercreutzia sp.]|uniref:hypothetical protein n=1 Tax=uncultured Adlercreutzia sp. TaxID=875803 RepID=UPI0025DF6D3E